VSEPIVKPDTCADSIKGLGSDTDGETATMTMIMEQRRGRVDDAIDAQAVTTEPTPEQEVTDCMNALHALECRFGTSTFHDGLQAFHQSGYNDRLDAVRPDLEEEARQAIHEACAGIESKVKRRAIAELGDNPFQAILDGVVDVDAKTVLSILAAGMKANEQDRRSANWRSRREAADATAASIPVPPCPKWCTEGEHVYEARLERDDVWVPTRTHMTEIIRHESADRGISTVEIGQTEYVEDGAAHLEKPAVWCDIDSDDPGVVRMFSRRLAEAATELEKMAGRATPA
jgi:uncharacterized protein DUF6907